MNDYINESADVFNEEPKKKGFTFGKLFKYIIAVIIFAVYAILFVRCYMSNDHKIVEKVMIDETFVDAYNADKENFQVLKYGIKESWTAVREGRLLEYNNLYHIPLARQLQFSVKFNTDLAGFEYTQEIPFKFRLCDGDGVEYTDYRYEYAEKYGYGYIRLCFNGIDLIKRGEYDAVEDKTNTTYTLYVEIIDAHGDYTEIAKARIYDGATASRPVEFEL